MSKEPRDLQELKESLCEGDCQECDTPKQLLEIISTLTAKVKRYEECLKYYADEMSYTVDSYEGISGEMRSRVVLYGDSDERNDVYSYAGRRARAALNQGECKNE